MLSELLGLDGYFVKQVQKECSRLTVTVEPENLPICPKCGQNFLSAPKDIRFQTVIQKG